MPRFVLGMILVCLALCNPVLAGASGPTPEISAGTRKTFTCADRYGSSFNISYVDTGMSGREAVMLIHGFGASAYTWREVIHALAANHRVIAPDLKGFGASDKPDDGHYSVFDQAEVVDALVRHLGLQDVVIGGHSMGGTIAMILASDPVAGKPYRISRLMLFDAPLFRQRLPFFIMALDIPFLGEAGLYVIPADLVVRWVLRECYYDDGLIRNDEVAAYAAGLSTPGGRKALVRTAEALADLNASGHPFDFSKVRMPVLIVWGKNDSVVPRGYAYALRDALPGPVYFHMLDRCGHFPMTEKPQEVIPIIQEFLD
jgi:pimeloyl-ACP methyl ester carboxylesterase